MKGSIRGNRCRIPSHIFSHTALRHTSKYHVWRRVKQNGRQGKYRSQSPNIGRIEWSYLSRTYRREVQQFDEDDDLVYILYFKDRAVFSLNATGAFSDGITRAVSWFEIIKVVLWSNFYPLIFWAHHVEFHERMKTPFTVFKYLH